MAALKAPRRELIRLYATAAAAERLGAEIGARGLETSATASAAEHMQASSDLFKVLRYEADLAKAGAVLEQIAAHEVAALADMTKAWADVKLITERAPMVNPIAAE